MKTIKMLRRFGMLGASIFWWAVLASLAACAETSSPLLEAGTPAGAPEARVDVY